MAAIGGLRSWFGHEEHSNHAESVFLVGLGRFGTALGQTLMDLDIEVLAVDANQGLVDEWASKLTHVRVADATSQATLEQLGAKNFDAAVVAIGTGVEASILATAALYDLGIRNIWAKAITEQHGRILERVGALHVVFPEKDVGHRIAQMVTGQVVDYFRVEDNFVLAEMRVPTEMVGRSLADCAVRQKFGITVVCAKQKRGSFTYVTPETVMHTSDLIVVAGSPAQIDRFGDLPTAE